MKKPMSPNKDDDAEKESKGDDESGEDGLTSNHPIFMCKVCHKEFGSGKALGGHMRVHAQQTPQQQQQQLKMNDSLSSGGVGVGGIGSCKSSYLHDLVKDGKPTCSLCNKTFVSLKSLFGHMRCHPDREWRGMQPPPPPTHNPTDLDNIYVESCSVGTITSTPVDLLLSGWSTKSRRSRNLTNSNPTDQPHAAASAAAAAADDNGLMLLAAVKQQQLDDDDDDVFEGEEGSALSNYYNQPKRQGDEEELSQATCMTTKQNNTIGKKRKRKTVKLKDLDPTMSSNNINNSTPPPAKCYKCATCDKSFASPQALGGHRSSAHNKIFNRNTSQELDKEGSSKTNSIHNHHQQHPATIHPPAARITIRTAAVVAHVCKICDKVFPSGQALGGHKRRHRQQTTATAAAAADQPESAVEHPPSSSSSSSLPAQHSAATAHTNNKPRLHFDLNQLPPDETCGFDGTPT